MAVCHPRLLEGEHALRVPADLRHHTLIHDHTIPDELERPSWEEWLKRAGASDVDPTRGPRFTDAALALGAALDGLGIVLTLEPLVSADVAAGRLAVPFPVTLPSRGSYYLVIADAIAERPPVAAFRDWILAAARTRPSRRSRRG